MKFRGWLLMLLFVHVLLHPLVHVAGTSGAGNNFAVSDGSAAQNASLNADRQCELCRVGHNTIVTRQLPKSALLNPRWIRTALQAVNYASLHAGHRIPSRAPPSL